VVRRRRRRRRTRRRTRRRRRRGAELLQRSYGRFLSSARETRLQNSSTAAGQRPH